MLLSASLLQARPVEKRAALPSFMDHSNIQRYVREKDFSTLCDLRNRLLNLSMEAETENDLNILEEGLENLKEATRSLENFHCQVPVIVTLITSTEETTSEENGTNSPILPDPTRLGNDQDAKSFDDCVVDYKEEDGSRDYFVEVNGILHYVQENSFKIKVLALFSIVGICGAVYLGLIIFGISWSCLHYKQKRKSKNLQTIDV